MIERGRGKQDDRPDETGSRTCRQGGKKRLSREGEGGERERERSFRGEWFANTFVSLCFPLLLECLTLSNSDHSKY